MHKNLHSYILAPLSVSLVVLTLGAAFGVLSGRGALLGMVSAVVVTLITALLKSSSFGVSSPTGPMTAAIAVILVADQKWLTEGAANFSAGELLNLTMLLAALFLIIFRVLRLQNLVKFVPNLVVAGFVNGIAVLILLAQLRAINTTNDWLLVGATFVITMILSSLGKKWQHPVVRILASSLIVIVGMSLMAAIFNLNVSYLAIEGGLQDISLTLPDWQNLDWSTTWFVSKLALELALICLLDTLLTAVLMEQKTDEAAKYGREVVGQSLAMALTGLLGGIPSAQSTVPSMMLYKEHADPRWGKLILAGFCLILTVLFADLLAYVPQAVFAGVILKIAIDVADFTVFKTLLKRRGREGNYQYWGRKIIVVGTLLSTVLLSLNLAVIGFTLFFVAWNYLVKPKYRILDLVQGQEMEGLTDEV